MANKPTKTQNIYEALSNIETFNASMIHSLDNGSEYMKARDVQQVAEQFKASLPSVDVGALWDKHSFNANAISGNLMSYENFLQALTEARKGMFTEDEIIELYGQARLKDMPRETFARYLKFYLTERKGRG